MMKIERSRFLAFCEAVLAIAQESRVWLKKDGIEARAVDAANVALVTVKMPKGAFEVYKEETGVLGFDLPKLKTATGLMKSGVITLEQDKNGKLQITDGSTRYSNALLNVNTIRKDPSMPDIALPASIQVSAKELQESIVAMGKIGDKIRFSLQDKVLTLTTEGDTDLLVKEIEGEAVRAIKEPAMSLFSTDYLKEISRVFRDADTATVSMNTDHPIRIECTVDQIELQYLVAPRIEKE